MSKFTSRIKSLSKLEYFYVLTGLACLAIGIEKVMENAPLWKLAVIFFIGIIILFITYKRGAK